MAAAEKFLFDLSFDGPGGPVAGTPTRGPVTPAEPTFSRADVTLLEGKARAEGEAAGRAAAISAHEQQLSAALAAIGNGVKTLLASQDEAQREGERQALELCRALLPKLFPTLTKCQGMAEITTMVAKAMREFVDEPRLVVRLPDALFERAQAQLTPLGEATGYPGKLVILGDETLTGADCRVEWADGGVERDLNRTWREIEAAIVRAIEASGATATPTQPAAESGI
jgi:flagellar assembly protein FliH